MVNKICSQFQLCLLLSSYPITVWKGNYVLWWGSIYTAKYSKVLGIPAGSGVYRLSWAYSINYTWDYRAYYPTMAGPAPAGSGEGALGVLNAISHLVLVRKDWLLKACNWWRKLETVCDCNTQWHAHVCVWIRLPWVGSMYVESEWGCREMCRLLVWGRCQSHLSSTQRKRILGPWSLLLFFRPD